MKMNHDDLISALKELGWDDQLIDTFFAENRLETSSIVEHKLISIEQNIIDANQPILQVNES